MPLKSRTPRISPAFHPRPAVANRRRKIDRSLPRCAVLVLFACGTLQAGEPKATPAQASSLPDSAGDGSPSTEVTGSVSRGGASSGGEAEELPTPSSELPPETPTNQTPQSSSRTELNLLGQLDAASGESRRNENVRITLIDNAVLRELNIRMGTTATVVKEFRADRNYFGSEFGGKPSSLLHLPEAAAPRFHGNLHAAHNNSIFSARSFFQVGDVRPARENDYGFRVGFPVWRGAQLTINGSQQKIRGSVNGNVLVPRADERTPLTHDPLTGEPVDPATREFVARIFSAYPAEPPNRPDIDPRALNTNSPQSIDNDHLGSRVDQSWSTGDRLALDYRFTAQTVEAFQLVGGQNPDTTTKNHAARITWNRAWSPRTTIDFSVGFDRLGSLLVPEETSLGIVILPGFALDWLGPGSSIPIDRAWNSFRYAGQAKFVRGRHQVHAGFEVLRRHTNGFESAGHRGIFVFGDDFGHDAITNLRLGKPRRYILATGHIYRGFRNWDMQYYLGDQWRATANLTLNVGLRYQPVTAVSEVNALTDVPYGCDCNNWAPRFGFAYRPGGKWGVLRGAYGIQYGQIFPVTFGQSRFNLPRNVRLSLDAPALIDPLEGLGAETRSTVFEMDPELVAPYSHQYNFSWEGSLFGDWKLALGYVGSRTHHLLNMWYLNRARVVPGIEQTTETINDRRPDARFFDIRHVQNSSRAFYDAAKITLTIPRWRGLSSEASYWFSKAIDLGGNYTGTASGRDARRGRSQSEFNSHPEMRGLSPFDQPHAFLWSADYELPRFASRERWLRQALGAWDLSTVLALKSGTPFTVISGSDGPGFGNVDGAAGDRPHVVDPSILGRTIDNPDTSRQRLPASAFAYIEPAERSGNLGRSTFRKDGVWNVNARLSRRWPLGGEKSLVLRAESINLFNSPQFAEPGRELTSPNFGQITNTLNDGRTFRFLLRLSF